jgi:hypothetical protein
MVGSIIVFAAAGDQRWGRAGVLLAIPILITFAPITTNAFDTLSLPFDPTVAGIIFFSSMLLILGAGILRRPGAAVAIAAVLGILQAFLWWFSPWAAHTYAAAVGLPLRDGLTPLPPDLPNAIPMFLIVAAAAVEALLWMIRTRGVDARRPLLLTGAVTGLIVAASLPLQQYLTDPTSGISPTDIPIIVIVGLPLGVLAGFLAARFIAMVRALAPVTKEVR